MLKTALSHQVIAAAITAGNSIGGYTASRKTTHAMFTCSINEAPKNDNKVISTRTVLCAIVEIHERFLGLGI